jgi:predicted metal-dependent peptidase
MRILLRHPYRQAPAAARQAYIASNITLNEYTDFKTLPYHASDFWSDTAHKKQHYEFYCRELMQDSQSSSLSEHQSTDEGAAGEDAGNAAENAELWHDDEFMDMKVAGLIQFAKDNENWGSIAGALKETIIASLKPVINYRRILNSFRASIISSNKTLTRFRPSRRYGRFYMGRKSAFTTRLLVGVDVSGSISNKELTVFYSTINRFFKYGIEHIDVQQFDAELQGETLVMKAAKRTINIKGRGGTSFQPIIDYYEQNRSKFNGLIIFTDGYACKPSVPERLKHSILWICNNKRNYRTHKDWIERLGRCAWIEGV